MAEGHRFTAFERECLHSLEDQGSSSGEEEGGEVSGRGNVLWDDYESAALATVRLYQSRGWREFQTAAAATTQLYKDSVETTKRAREQGRQAGRRRALKEILGYLRAQQGLVRRTDVLAFLAGKTPPAATAPRRSSSGHGSPVLRHLDALRLAPAATPPTPDGLVMFHQALARLEPTEGAQGFASPRASASPRRHQLQRFFVEQVRRHRKRGPGDADPGASPPDSPTLKRRRL